jgi:hypothetical protein
MLTYSTNLKAILDNATTKLDWANKLQNAIGSVRTLRCFRDANSAAPDPATTGAEFLNMKSSGPLTISSGNITGLGKLSNTTIHTATDLSTGASVLRLEGNGYWVQGTLGITGSGCDFVLSGNPTGLPNTGYAFASGTGTKAPRLLSSGTGPKAPPIRSTTPTIIELVDWANPASPVVVGIATFKEANRQDDWVFQDAEMAAEIGDVAIYQVDNTIKWTSPAAPRRFELGGLLLIASNYNSEDGVTQLEQMLLSFKPYGRWSTYPAMDTFVRAKWPVIDNTTSPPTYGPCSNPDTADRTIPQPFKINLYTQTGYNNGAANRTPLFTHEWKAFNDKPTLPINSPQLSEVQTTDEPSIPRFNCGMMLPWQNMRTRLSSKAGKYFPGVETYSYDHPTFGTHGGPSSNAYHPLAAYRYGQADSMAHWYVLPPYPLKNDQAKDNAYLTAYESRPRDPSMFTNRDHYPWYRAMGYKYQAGSLSGHDWVTGKGGQRFDRASCPSVLAIYAANPNWKRPEGNVPIRDMLEGWGMAYFNHSNHWIRNVQTFESLPKADMLKSSWIFVGAYYGIETAYATLGKPLGPQVSIDICAIINGKSRTAFHNDPEGYMYYSGWQRDSLHSYCNAGWWAFMLNSPMHAIAAKHDFDTQWMSALGSAPPTTDPKGYYGQRIHAWRVLAHVMAWKVATEHPLGYSKEDIEARLQIELELLYDKIYKPAFIDNEQTIFSAAIRNLGTAVSINPSGDTYQTAGGSLGLYMVHTLTLMRQVGMWAAMRKRSDKCRVALDMMIRNLDRFVIDYVMDTDCRDAYYAIAIVGKASATQYTVADVPADWVAQKAMLDQYLPILSPTIDRNTATTYLYPQRFKRFLTAYDDRAEEQTGCPHLYMQYLKARRDYWPDYPNARLGDAIAKLQAEYDSYLVKRAAGQAYSMTYLFPAHGPFLPPTEVGPKD